MSMSHQFSVKDWEKEALIPGTLANLVLTNILNDEAIEEGMRTKVFLERCLKMSEELNKEKEMMLLAQREKAKYEEEKHLEEDLELLRAETEQQMAETKDTTGLAELNNQIQDKLVELATEKDDLDADLEEKMDDLQATSDSFNDRQNATVAKIKDTAKQQLNDGTFVFYGLEAADPDNPDKKKPVTLSNPEQVLETMIDIANKPLSTDIPKLNPGRVRQVNDALDEQDDFVEKTNKTPKVSVEQTLVNELKVLGEIAAMRWYAEKVLHLDDPTGPQLLKVIKANPHFEKVMLEVQRQTNTQEAQSDIKDFYRDGKDYVDLAQQKDQNLDKTNYLKGVSKEANRRLPPTLRRG